VRPDQRQSRSAEWLQKNSPCRFGELAMPGGGGLLQVALASGLDSPAGVLFLVVILLPQVREIVVIGPATVLPALPMVEITAPGVRRRTPRVRLCTNHG
jgi:hypothetical protein